MKTFAAVVSISFLIGINACKKETKNETPTPVTSTEEDMASVNSMNNAFHKMGIYNDSLTNTQIHHEQLYYDSIYHHHDSLFSHHHTIYHHGDTTHHHPHHTQVQHHAIDSLHNAHTPHHP